MNEKTQVSDQDHVKLIIQTKNQPIPEDVQHEPHSPYYSDSEWDTDTD